MIRSSTGRKEIYIEALKKDIEIWKEIFARFVYQKKFLKIDWFVDILQPSWKIIETILCEDWFSYRPFDIMEIKYSITK